MQKTLKENYRFIHTLKEIFLFFNFRFYCLNLQFLSNKKKKNAFSSEKYCIFIFRLMFRFDKQKRKKNIHDPEGRAAVWFYNKWNDERDFPMISNFCSAQHQLFDFWIRHHLLIKWMKFPQKFSKKKFSLGHSVENQEFCYYLNFMLNNYRRLWIVVYLCKCLKLWFT